MAVHLLVVLEYHRTKDGFAGSILTMENKRCRNPKLKQVYHHK
jgi:hypothetical protein